MYEIIKLMVVHYNDTQGVCAMMCQVLVELLLGSGRVYIPCSSGAMSSPSALPDTSSSCGEGKPSYDTVMALACGHMSRGFNFFQVLPEVPVNPLYIFFLNSFNTLSYENDLLQRWQI